MKYKIEYTSTLKKQYKKIKKQGKDLIKLKLVIEKLAKGEELDVKYKNHKLINDKVFNECWECHIAPDWLLVYKIYENNLILLLFAMGSHSDLFE